MCRERARDGEASVGERSPALSPVGILRIILCVYSVYDDVYTVCIHTRTRTHVYICTDLKTADRTNTIVLRDTSLYAHDEQVQPTQCLYAAVEFGGRERRGPYVFSNI